MPFISFAVTIPSVFNKLTRLIEFMSETPKIKKAKEIKNIITYAVEIYSLANFIFLKLIASVNLVLSPFAIPKSTKNKILKYTTPILRILKINPTETFLIITCFLSIYIT